MVQTITFQPKTTQKLCFSKSCSVVMKYLKMLSQYCKIIQLKTLNLVLYLSLIFNSIPNLYSLICSEMNTALNQKHNTTVKQMGSSYKFLFPLKTVTFLLEKDFVTCFRSPDMVFYAFKLFEKYKYHLRPRKLISFN